MWYKTCIISRGRILCGAPHSSSGVLLITVKHLANLITCVFLRLYQSFQPDIPSDLMELHSFSTRVNPSRHSIATEIVYDCPSTASSMVTADPSSSTQQPPWDSNSTHTEGRTLADGSCATASTCETAQPRSQCTSDTGPRINIGED